LSPTQTRAPTPFPLAPPQHGGLVPQQALVDLDLLLSRTLDLQRGAENEDSLC
jgi:hypothetical protein